MTDELVSGLLKDSDLRVVLVRTTELCRQARARHRAEPASAALLAQGLTAAVLLASLQKRADSRLNLQLECDGPVRGFFADADPTGAVRGYVKNPYVAHLGAEGEYQWRPLLGNQGYLSVLRELDTGEYYRSAVELERFDVAADLEHYFAQSDQLPSRVYLALLPGTEDGRPEPLGTVAGLLLQPLPNGDSAAFHSLGEQLAATFRSTLAAHAAASPSELLRALVPRPDLELLQQYPLAFRCSCSKERVMRALVTLGREELRDMLEKDGQAELTCQFCESRYVVGAEELRALLTTAQA